MRDFVFKGRRHFGELLDGEERIASNVLTDRLRQLEMHGIVTRSDDPVDRRRVQYTLTEKGLALVPAMLELILWGATYDRHTAAPPEFIERLRTDRDGLLREILAGHRAPARNPVD